MGVYLIKLKNGSFFRVLIIICICGYIYIIIMGKKKIIIISKKILTFEEKIKSRFDGI